MTWFKQLGFTKNPLDFRPDTRLVGLDVEEQKLTSYIHNGEICFLNGLTGAGKSSLLKKVQQKNPHFEYIYLNAEDLPDGFSLEKEIKKKRKFLDLITFRKYPKKPPVLLIDEFQATDPNVVLQVKGKWEAHDKGVHAVVIAQISRELANTTGSFKERLGNRIIDIGSRSEGELREILRQRLERQNGKNLLRNFSEDAISLLITQSNANVRRLLEFTEAVLAHHYQRFGDLNPMLKDNYEISYFVVKDILSELHALEEKSTAQGAVLTKEELRTLKVIEKLDTATHTEIASELQVPLGVAAGLLGSLKRKGTIKQIGSKHKRKAWELSGSIRRQIIEV